VLLEVCVVLLLSVRKKQLIVLLGLVGKHEKLLLSLKFFLQDDIIHWTFQTLIRLIRLSFLVIVVMIAFFLGRVHLWLLVLYELLKLLPVLVEHLARIDRVVTVVLLKVLVVVRVTGDSRAFLRGGLN
jgi:hypothetical protein